MVGCETLSVANFILPVVGRNFVPFNIHCRLPHKAGNATVDKLYRQSSGSEWRNNGLYKCLSTLGILTVVLLGHYIIGFHIVKTSFCNMKTTLEITSR